MGFPFLHNYPEPSGIPESFRIVFMVLKESYQMLVNLQDEYWKYHRKAVPCEMKGCPLEALRKPLSQAVMTIRIIIVKYQIKNVKLTKIGKIRLI
jgi:hypothetical protein